MGKSKLWSSHYVFSPKLFFQLAFHPTFKALGLPSLAWGVDVLMGCLVSISSTLNYRSDPTYEIQTMKLKRIA